MKVAYVQATNMASSYKLTSTILPRQKKMLLKGGDVIVGRYRYPTPSPSRCRESLAISLFLSLT
jgi:hypothetical protein